MVPPGQPGKRETRITVLTTGAAAIPIKKSDSPKVGTPMSVSRRLTAAALSLAAATAIVSGALSLAGHDQVRPAAAAVATSTVGPSPDGLIWD